ncbi:efflux RND transporter permease subunit, partial [bacterium]|nr:efflux RND transporter permease subunit [bacterium]
ILKVMPMVLILVLSVSLLEGFLILPNHLLHALDQQVEATGFRKTFIFYFELIKDKYLKALITKVLEFRYLFLSFSMILFFLSVSLLVNGTIKFQAMPALEGDHLVARLMLNQGTPFEVTKSRVQQIVDGLKQLDKNYLKKYGSKEHLVKNIKVEYAINKDVDEKGPHVATINVDLLKSDLRKIKILEIIEQWKTTTGQLFDVSELNFKEPSFGPSGIPIHIRLISSDLNQLEIVSNELKDWLNQFDGVKNVIDDLRFSKREISMKLQPGALLLGLNAQMIASQLRSAYQGAIADEVYFLNKNYEISVELDAKDKSTFSQLQKHEIISNTGKKIPLSELVYFSSGRSFSKITRSNSQRSVNVTANSNSRKINVVELINIAQNSIFKDFRKKYPQVKIELEGEIKSSKETGISMRNAFIGGVFGVFLLLVFQFASFIEPIIIILSIPLALIGVLFGHYFMGYDFTMPSALGFISLAGIVVNDSILLVEFIHLHWKENTQLKDSVIQAVVERFRPIFLTSITTIAGTAPLLFESSLQVQILIPLVISLIFGMLSATLLILFVIPCVYLVLEDFSLLKRRP